MPNGCLVSACGAQVHYDSTVYKSDQWISTSSDRLAPLDTHTSAQAPLKREAVIYL